MSLTLNIPFTEPTNYTVSDASKIEVSDGKVKLKSLVPANATCWATYTNNINLNYGGGVLTGTAVGGAAILNEKLDLAHNDVRYVDYAALNNADSQQVGCINLKIIPNYSGAPVGNNQIYIVITKETSDASNLVALNHKTTGQFSILINNSIGESIFVADLGEWLPTAGQKYEVELNWDITTGATRLFIDKIQFGVTQTATGTRDNSIGLLRVGSSVSGTYASNFSIEDLIVYDTVQHTTDYTAGYTLPETRYNTGNPTIEIDASIKMEGLDSFTETESKTGSDEIKYILKKGTVWYYYNSGWIVSDGTYAQSNTAAEIETNKATFTTVDISVKVKIFLHSDDGSTTPYIDLLSIGYDFSGETPDTIETCVVWWYNKNTDNTINSKSCYVELAEDAVRYKDNIVLQKKKIEIKPDINTGYSEIELVESENMVKNKYYNFYIGNDILKRKVPNVADASLWELEL